MKSKTLMSLAGIVLALGAALYNWKYGTAAADSATSGSSSSVGTATQEPRASGPNASESTTSSSSSKAAPTKPATNASIAKPSVSSNAPANATTRAAPAETKPGVPAGSTSTVGFGSTRAFDDHYEKHGSEFGSITQAQYLALAQQVRDAPVGGSILEAVRDDGVISRFDKKSGAFLAFNENKTIRTFFKPNDGVRYFERQIEKAH
ncbi:MAG: hypothetical protein SGI72_14470 [Planctomycetota bacterium]|nr:hypothetical protein [Planctomycetota bacterium]